jgi:hypothetical protein
MPASRRLSRRDRRTVVCGAGGALAVCWLLGAVFLATGAVLVSGICVRGAAQCNTPAGLSPLVGHVLQVLGWTLILVGPVLAAATYRKLHRSWVGRRVISRLMPWPIQPRRRG